MIFFKKPGLKQNRKTPQADCDQQTWVGVTNIDGMLTNMNKYHICIDLYELVYPIGITNINHIDALLMPQVFWCLCFLWIHMQLSPLLLAGAPRLLLLHEKWLYETPCAHGPGPKEIPSYSPQEGAPQGNRQGNIVTLQGPI